MSSIHNIKNSYKKHVALINDFKKETSKYNSFDILNELDSILNPTDKKSNISNKIIKIINNIFYSFNKNNNHVDEMEKQIASYMINGNFEQCEKYLKRKGNVKPRAFCELGKIYLNGYAGTYGEIKGINTQKALSMFKHSYKNGFIDGGFYASVALHKIKQFNKAQTTLNGMVKKHRHVKSAELLIKILQHRALDEKNTVVIRKINTKILHTLPVNFILTLLMFITMDARYNNIFFGYRP